MKAQTTRTLNTKEIKEILKNANMDFESVVNKALNHYLSKLFLSCPFTDELCLTRKQCMGCEAYNQLEKH